MTHQEDVSLESSRHVIELIHLCACRLTTAGPVVDPDVNRTQLGAFDSDERAGSKKLGLQQFSQVRISRTTILEREIVMTLAQSDPMPDCWLKKLVYQFVNQSPCSILVNLQHIVIDLGGPQCMPVGWRTVINVVTGPDEPGTDFQAVRDPLL